MLRTLRALPPLAVLALLLACQGAELRRLNREQIPVRMAVGLPAGLPERERAESAYTQGLQAALGRALALMPGDSLEPAPLITVEVAGRFSRPSLTRDAVSDGAKLGRSVALYTMAYEFGQGKDLLSGMGNGLAWGLGSGLVHGATENAYLQSTYKSECKRLGYEPSLIKARISLLKKGADGPIQVGEVSGLEVVAQMRPLPESDRQDLSKLLEEEGRALGQAVWGVLIKEHSLVSREFLAQNRP